MKYRQNLVRITTILLILFLDFSYALAQDKGEVHFNLGLNYPKIGFVDSDGHQSLLSDFNNVSSNHLKLGYKRKVVGDVGLLFSIISNRYDVLARYNTNSGGFNYVKYDLDYISGSLAFTLDIKLPNDLYVVPNVGLNYNYLLSGFQSFNGNLYNLKENVDFVPFSYSLNPGFYFSKSISHFINFQLGYNYVFDLVSQERTTPQTYDLQSHTVFVGAAIKIGSFKKEKKKQKIVENKLDKMERSFSKMKQGMEDIRLYVDSVFVPGSNLNSKLQTEIENFISIQSFSQGSLEPDFVVLFPSNDPYYYNLFDDTMLDLLSVAQSESTLFLKIVGYADLNGKDQSNLILSKSRTETIKNYLLQNGVNPDKISVEFLGETSKFDSEVLMSNRRVEIFISTN